MTPGERSDLLNRLAQRIRPLDEGAHWFERHDQAGRRAILDMLAEYVIQARADEQDRDEAITRAGVKEGDTAAVLLRVGEPRLQLRKICGLPGYQQVPAFRVLVSLLGVADDRRRVSCAGQCTHAWHQLRR
ncbi:DUF5958 family protein [Amycolatopsis sp. OK19-0408]|uniref:DUF5958 family protein n=1 Tax=Amycolatopsis iheyensis TaxID=2945988 RepID=A0A9X2SIY1_9PSEU|nr:DUF5958 family protein [Amycolatopsis iheyensis]MCR6484207.1 DUF5958 family protein [Amycolatopsis iheyensis]